VEQGILLESDVVEINQENMKEMNIEIADRSIKKLLKAIDELKI
jgi:hypothetical protein